MFKETDDGQTQYCPMCEEWAEKYKRLKQENVNLKILGQTAQDCYEHNLKVGEAYDKELRKLRTKLDEIKRTCENTLLIMNKDSGTNEYAGGRCIEAESILKIIKEEDNDNF